MPKQDQPPKKGTNRTIDFMQNADGTWCTSDECEMFYKTMMGIFQDLYNEGLIRDHDTVATMCKKGRDELEKRMVEIHPVFALCFVKYKVKMYAGVYLPNFIAELKRTEDDLSEKAKAKKGRKRVKCKHSYLRIGPRFIIALQRCFFLSSSKRG